ncbi:MAG: hypothetical protein US86_C0005G0008 [Candidatus Daviesbacteria bacterium GW2011_GWA2_38_24]|uniref:IPT/TIG domain-containing protein n=1 Tax=Candidatus Daviesbacteria bacterium GW2011_GWA2_38_24 TaxID=1618422 RepID=A0A0G0JHZ5_9BACT|nr:MAG: hypothetical protein US86_C0005G0008 [Candidatus Daviesbacteria bacterium GW2011_GWA2_38_24]
MNEFIEYLKVKKNLVNLLTLGILILGIPLGVNLAKQQQIYKSFAGTQPITFLATQNGCIKEVNNKKIAVCPTLDIELRSQPTQSSSNQTNLASFELVKPVKADHAEGTEGWYCDGDEIWHDKPDGDHEFDSRCGDNQECKSKDAPEGYTSDAECVDKETPPACNWSFLRNECTGCGKARSVEQNCNDETRISAEDVDDGECNTEQLCGSGGTSGGSGSTQSPGKDDDDDSDGDGQGGQDDGWIIVNGPECNYDIKRGCWLNKWNPSTGEKDWDLNNCEEPRDNHCGYSSPDGQTSPTDQSCDHNGDVDPDTWSLIEEWECQPGNPGVKAHKWACFGTDGTPQAVKYTDGVSDTEKCPISGASGSAQGGKGSSITCTKYPSEAGALSNPPPNTRWEAVDNCSKSCDPNRNTKANGSPDCPKNTDQKGYIVEANSSWCYGFTDGAKCMQLRYTGDTSAQAADSNKCFVCENNKFKETSASNCGTNAPTCDPKKGEQPACKGATVNQSCGAAAVRITKYKIAESKEALASAPEKDYELRIKHELKDTTPGTKTIFVEYKMSDGKTNGPHFLSIEYVGPAAKVTGSDCSIDLSGSGATLTINGENFGTDGTVKIGSTTLKNLDWKTDKIEAKLENRVPSQDTFNFIVTRKADNTSTTGSCDLKNSQISLGSKAVCGIRSKVNKEKVEIQIKEDAPNTKVTKEKGVLTSTNDLVLEKTKLTQGKDYIVWFKLPNSLGKQIKFKANGSTTSVDTEVPLGNVNTDTVINANDWSICRPEIGKRGSNLKCDFVEDALMNALDYGCLRTNYQKTGDRPLE